MLREELAELADDAKGNPCTMPPRRRYDATSACGPKSHKSAIHLVVHALP